MQRGDRYVADGTVDGPHDGLGAHAVEVLAESLGKYYLVEFLGQWQGVGGRILQLLPEIEDLAIEFRFRDRRGVGFARAAGDQKRGVSVRQDQRINGHDIGAKLLQRLLQTFAVA